jgi:hypothetical protein
VVRAITNVLSSAIAKKTYAQIVDGLPQAHVALDQFNEYRCTDHPLLTEHKELCPGATEEAERLCSGFDANTLLMPSRVRHLLESCPLTAMTGR